MIIDPIDLADRLAELLKAKNQNETYVVRKQHRVAVVEAEILLRQLFSMNNPYKTKKPLSDDDIIQIACDSFYGLIKKEERHHFIRYAKAIEERHGIK